MFLKRFRANNVRDALRAIREDLGPQALVLSTEMVTAYGWRGLMGVREVEITAAVDREPSVTRLEESADRHPDGATGFSRTSKDHAAPSPIAELTARLTATGLDEAMAVEVANSIPTAARRGASPARLRDALASRLADLAASDREYARAEVFIGPPGCGKTTTIAKIAAQERARGGQRLALLAADGFRIGAVEQLRTYADILDAPFKVARTPDDLHALLAQRSRTPVLVDTAGRSPSDNATKELFRVVGEAQGVRTHLVLPASTSVTAARRILDGYAEARPTRLVLTKVDEADSLSPLVSLLHERQVPISYLGTGQRVPEDLNRATAQLLAASVLGESAPVHSSLS
jgi:flagellar biosynthesis protein FlhF